LAGYEAKGGKTPEKQGESIKRAGFSPICCVEVAIFDHFYTVRG
jgi:hypothetical protein